MMNKPEEFYSSDDLTLNKLSNKTSFRNKRYKSSSFWMPVLIAGFLIFLILSLVEFKSASNRGLSIRAQEPLIIGDRPAIEFHVNQDDITNGLLSFDTIINIGASLFQSKFNSLDGHGRPASTGSGAPTKRFPDQPALIRTSGPEASACASCHNDPRVGGSGDFVTNAFVLANDLDPVTFSISHQFSLERNPPSVIGIGPIELLAREMTADLLGIRESAISEAARLGIAVTETLRTKGVSFGSITADPDGALDTSGVVGVDGDLIIKPFHQKGVVRSIREFTVGAMNQHLGMQATERFGAERTGSNDFDEDGVADELTLGDITAVVIWQAAQNTPGRIIPDNPDYASVMQSGEDLFNQIGCGSCHKPDMVLESSLFCEPYYLNPEGTFNDTDRSYCFDLTVEGFEPRPEGTESGGAVIRAFTDFKRHVICDDADPHFCNDELEMGGVPTDQFITKRLWDVGSTSPYGHRGDLTTLTEAILAHGGEARSAKLAFASLPSEQKDYVVEFLKSMRVMPDGSALIAGAGSGSSGSESAGGCALAGANAVHYDLLSIMLILLAPLLLSFKYIPLIQKRLS